jgi:uncharacterized DUF497 family protein
LNGFLTSFTETEKEMISVERVVEVKIKQNKIGCYCIVCFDNSTKMLAVCWYTSRRTPGIRISSQKLANRRED